MNYDVRHWGTGFGPASEATFSVTKSHPEELGVPDTENVATDVIGRPRQRLILDGDQPRRADPTDVLSRTLAKLVDGRKPPGTGTKPRDSVQGSERQSTSTSRLGPSNESPPEQDLEAEETGETHEDDGAGETHIVSPLAVGNRLADLVFPAGGVDSFQIVHFRGRIRFSDLSDRRETNSASTISRRHEELQDAGVLDRKSHHAMPPKVEYTLKITGETLYQRLLHLLNFLDEE